MRGLVRGALVAVGLLVLACSSSGDGGPPGQMSVWLTATSAEGNVYRLRNAGFRVSVVMGPEVQTLVSDDVTEPPPSSIALSVDPGSYTVELLGGWELYRVEPGDDVLVVAELASPQTVFVDVVSGGTASVVYRFRTNGEILQTGPGDISVSIEVEEDQCLSNPCDDGDPCTENDCDPTTGACTYPTAEDGTFCNMDPFLMFCVMGVCQNLCEGVDCSSQNECIVDGACVPHTGACSPGTDLPAGSPCDGGAVCDGSGACVECTDSVQCDDDNECTDEVCTVDSTCAQVSAPDGTGCAFGGLPGVCANGTCEDANLCSDANARCDDAAECTLNLCDPSTGDCSNPPEASGAACNNGNDTGVCDGLGTCVQCIDSAQCDDDNECTDDTCEGSVCVNAPQSGRVCTSVDGLPGQCLGATCNPGPPAVMAIHPADGTVASPCFNMVAYFDRPMDSSSIDGATVLVNQSITSVPLQVFYNPNNNSVIFAPEQCLVPSALHTISIRGVKDTQGREMTTAFTSVFVTNAVDCTGQVCGIQ